MVEINIREFAHNMSKYLKKVKKGERVILMERNKPIAELGPIHPGVTKPGWRRKVRMVKMRGISGSEVIERMRRGDS